MQEVEAGWVVMGPEPYFAHCERCDATIPKPSIPIGLDEFIAYCDVVIEAHKDCKPKGEA